MNLKRGLVLAVLLFIFVIFYTNLVMPQPINLVEDIKTVRPTSCIESDCGTGWERIRYDSASCITYCKKVVNIEPSQASGQFVNNLQAIWRENGEQIACNTYPGLGTGWENFGYDPVSGITYCKKRLVLTTGSNFVDNVVTINPSPNHGVNGGETDCDNTLGLGWQTFGYDGQSNTTFCKRFITITPPATVTCQDNVVATSFNVPYTLCIGRTLLTGPINTPHYKIKVPGVAADGTTMSLEVKNEQGVFLGQWNQIAVGRTIESGGIRITINNIVPRGQDSYVVFTPTLISVTTSPATVACCDATSQVNPCGIVTNQNECTPNHFIGNCQPQPDLCKRVCCTRTEGTATTRYILPEIECTRAGGSVTARDLQDILSQCPYSPASAVSYPKCSDYGYASFDSAGNIAWEKIGNLQEMVDNNNPQALHGDTCNPDAFSIWREGNDLAYFFVQGDNYGVIKGSLRQGTLLSRYFPQEFIPTDVLLAYAAPNEALAEPPTKFFASKGDLFKVCNEGGCSNPTSISGSLNLPSELIPPDSGSSYASTGEGNKAYYYFTKGRKVGLLDSNYRALNYQGGGYVFDLKNSVVLKKWPKSLLCPKTTSIFKEGDIFKYFFTSDGCKALRNSCTGQIEESIRGYNFEVGQRPFIVVITNKGEASKGIDIFVRKISSTGNVIQDFTSAPTYSCPSSSNQVCVYQLNQLVEADYAVKYQYYAKVKDASNNILSTIPQGAPTSLLWETYVLRNPRTNANDNNKGCNTLASYKEYNVQGNLVTVNCNTPLQNECFNGNILRRYYRIGRCFHDPSGISCKYDYDDVFCTGGCSNGVCTGEVSLTTGTPITPSGSGTTSSSCPARIDVFDYNLIDGQIAKIKAISNKPGRISIVVEGLGPNAIKVCGDLTNGVTECNYLSGSENPSYPNGAPLPDYYRGVRARYYAELVTSAGERISSQVKEATVLDSHLSNLNFCKDENSIVISGWANTPAVRCTSANAGQCNPGYCSRDSLGGISCSYPNNCVNNDALRTLVPLCSTTAGTGASTTTRSDLVNGYWNNLNNPLKGIDDELCGLGSQITSRIPLGFVGGTIIPPETITTCPARIDVFDYNLIVNKIARIKAVANKVGKIEIFAKGLTGVATTTEFVKVKICDNANVCEHYSDEIGTPSTGNRNGINLPISFSGNIVQYYAELTIPNEPLARSVTKLAQIGDQNNQNDFCTDENSIVIRGGANTPGARCTSANAGQCNPGYCSRSYSGTGDIGCFYPNNCVNNDAFQTLMSCPTTTTTCLPNEICGNGIDDNCANGIDEGCSCTTGSTQQCYPSTSDSNTCRYQQTCTNNQWGSCTKLDPQCPRPCTPGTTQSCPLQQGVCAGSTQQCGANNAWPGCNYNSISGYSATEICTDTLDNNCDGLINNDCNGPCS